MKLTVYREKMTGIFNSDLGCNAGKHRCDGTRSGGGAPGLVLERQRSSLEDVTSLPPNGDRKDRSSNMIMVRG